MNANMDDGMNVDVDMEVEHQQDSALFEFTAHAYDHDHTYNQNPSHNYNHNHEIKLKLERKYEYDLSDLDLEIPDRNPESIFQPYSDSDRGRSPPRVPSPSSSTSLQASASVLGLELRSSCPSPCHCHHRHLADSSPSSAETDEDDHSHNSSDAAHKRGLVGGIDKVDQQDGIVGSKVTMKRRIDTVISDEEEERTKKRVVSADQHQKQSGPFKKKKIDLSRFMKTQDRDLAQEKADDEKNQPQVQPGPFKKKKIDLTRFSAYRDRDLAQEKNDNQEEGLDYGSMEGAEAIQRSVISPALVPETQETVGAAETVMTVQRDLGRKQRDMESTLTQEQSEMDLDEATDCVVEVRRHKVKIDLDHFIRLAESQDEALGGHESGSTGGNTTHHRELDDEPMDLAGNGVYPASGSASMILDVTKSEPAKGYQSSATELQDSESEGNSPHQDFAGIPAFLLPEDFARMTVSGEHPSILSPENLVHMKAEGESKIQKANSAGDRSNGEAGEDATAATRDVKNRNVAIKKGSREHQRAQRAIFRATQPKLEKDRSQPEEQADHMASPLSIWKHRKQYFNYFGFQHFPQHDLPEHGIRVLKLSHLGPIEKHVEQHPCFPKLVELMENWNRQNRRHRDFPKVDPELAFAWFSACGRRWKDVEETAEHRAIIQRLSLALD